VAKKENETQGKNIFGNADILYFASQTIYKQQIFVIIGVFFISKSYHPTTLDLLKTFVVLLN
jgi:hypothetical protein